MELDVRIAGGTIVDGTGRPGFVADVGIRAGRVVEIGKLGGRARKTIDARDRVVAPGFVDIHTHYDAQILWDRMLTISPWHGVTTVVLGNCGFGVAPTRPDARDLILRTLEKVEGMRLTALRAGLGADWGFETFPQYLDTIERGGSAINVGVLVGHTPVRLYVMGEAATERSADADEVAAMRAIVKEAVAAGALGFATSKSATHVAYEGRPVPSRLADLDEIMSLATPLRELDTGVVQATVGRGLFFDEFCRIAREIGRPVTWTAMLAGMKGRGGHRPMLERSAQILAEGLPVYPQVSCRPLNFEFDWREPFPFESLAILKPASAGDLRAKMRLYADPDFRREFRAQTRPGARGTIGSRWDRTVVSYCPSDPELEERALETVAAERGVDPIDLMFDLSLRDGLTARFRMAMLNVDEDEVAELLADPSTVLGLSDAGAHASQLCDACFSTHLLHHWVRTKGVLSLETAIHMLTERPARIFGLVDRGRLAVGLPADVVVFDPETVAPGPLRRVHDLPGGVDRLIADAHGIDAVIVNGVVLREHGADRVDAYGALPGMLLRSTARGAQEGALR